MSFCLRVQRGSSSLSGPVLRALVGLSLEVGVAADVGLVAAARKLAAVGRVRVDVLPLAQLKAAGEDADLHA